MSSSVNAPYKSRLFNFLNRKSLQWGTQANKVFRQAKEVAKVGGQVLLYLGYLSFQAGRMVGHLLQERRSKLKALRLNASSQTSYPQLPPDQPLQKVLQAVESWDLLEPEQEADPSYLEGVAICLHTHSLVLVTETNQTLDILNSEQQKQLRQKISWEVADYHRSRRLGYQTQSFIPLLPTLMAPTSWGSGLTQSVLRLMQQVQRSPLAINFNVFQEATWVKPLPQSPTPVQTPPLRETFQFNFPDSETLNTLDETLAEIERHPLASGKQFVKEFRHSLDQLKEHPHGIKLRETLHTAIDDFLTPPNRNSPLSVSPNPQNLTSKTENVGQSSPSLIESRELPQQRSLLDHEDDPFSLRQLLHAAVDYFFGTLHQDNLLADQGLLHHDPETPWLSRQDLLFSGQDYPMLTTLPSSESRPVSDPWLSPLDLFEVKRDRTKVIETSESILFPQGSSTPGTPTGDLETHVRETCEKHKSFSTLLKGVANRFAGGTITNVQESSQKLAVQGSSSQNTGINHDPEWVETQAEPMGYIKHPLVSIVELLDGIILGIEDILVKFWHWWRTK